MGRLTREGAGKLIPTRLRERVDMFRFRHRWGFDPPPPWSDWTGYEVLLEEIERHGLDEVEGDVLEIGPLLGGGTAKLCGWFAVKTGNKRVVSVDIFDPTTDLTTTSEGWPMSDLYSELLAGRDQRTVFDEVTRHCVNLDVVVGDSSTVQLPVERLAFAFVDGNHAASHVQKDFERTWERLSPGGIVAFHDYGEDLPSVTRTLHEAIGRHATEISRVWTRSPALLFVQRDSA